MPKGERFERKVREYAAVRFGLPFRPEHLAGINFDSVASPRADYKIIVEATVNHTMEKVRGDIARLQIAKQKLIGEGVYAEVYLVLEREPTNFMQEGAKAAKIEVSSLETFVRNWFDGKHTWQLAPKSRLGVRFGWRTRPDRRPYVPVVFDDQDGRRYTIEELARRIKNGDLNSTNRRVRYRQEQGHTAILPRLCRKQRPKILRFRSTSGRCGARKAPKRFSGGHFSTLQLSASSEQAVDALHHGDLLLLLDGFDELAIQELGSEPGASASPSKNDGAGSRPTE